MIDVATGRFRRESGSHRRAHRRTALLVAGLCCAVVAASCGARVGPYLGASGTGGTSSATTQPGSTGSSGSTATTTVTNGSTGSSGSTGTNSSTGASRGTGNPAPIAASSFNFSPQAEAADCSGTSGNTASAPGITTSAIQIGNVSGLSGPLSGSFPQGPQAVQALFDAVNAAGGICGRALDLDVEDDGQDTSTNESDVENLIAKPVFAFAGSTSDADNGGVPAMVSAGTPDFGFAINCNRSEAITYWSVAAGSCYQPDGTSGPYFINDGAFALAQADGYLPKSMAFLSYSIAISAQAAQEYAYVYQHDFGGTICYTDYSISPVSASLEPDVEQMQADNCQGVFNTMDVTGNAKLLQALQQQSVSLSYVAATFDAYTPVMISTAGQSAAQGLLVDLPFTPLGENTTMTTLYQQQLSEYEPGDEPSGFGFLAWLGAQLMIYALLQTGRNPTRASLVDELNSIKNFTAGGAVGPYSPGEHSVAACDLSVTVSGDNFVRKAPSSGFYCNGQTVQASS